MSEYLMTASSWRVSQPQRTASALTEEDLTEKSE